MAEGVVGCAKWMERKRCAASRRAPSEDTSRRSKIHGLSGPLPEPGGCAGSATLSAAHAIHRGLGQLKVMSAIERCRTAALGGHVTACRECAHTHIAYNSCRNRPATTIMGPKCQGATARDWLAARPAELLPVPYFHVVFTVPAQIADIAYQNKAARPSGAAANLARRPAAASGSPHHDDDPQSATPECRPPSPPARHRRRRCSVQCASGTPPVGGHSTMRPTSTPLLPGPQAAAPMVRAIQPRPIARTRPRPPAPLSP